MSSNLILLPSPQRWDHQEGTHRLEPNRLIWLGGKQPHDLLRAGRIVQEALALVGPRWELTAAAGTDSGRLGASITVDPEAVGQSQGYHLHVTPDQIRVIAHDSAGAFYAAMTLRQIARQEAGSGRLPCLRIEDWPDFPHRGVMLDVSRDKVPTMETLFALVDQLAQWKINEFQLYTEHTFAYRNHREVWAEASPMTGEQVMALDAYCRERFVELVPNQNSFSHFARWLNHPRYRPLSELPDSPRSLCPVDPGSIALLGEMYNELLPHFSSRMVNVGCDETWDLGKGRSKEACKERGVGRVYLEFLLKIHGLVKAHGRTMQFWGDIIMNHPELIGELPEGIIALEWGYEADHPFAQHGKKFAEAGVPYYVCPGTSTWNAITGRTDNAMGNLRNAAENGRANGAIGYLITDWGDNGHWQHLPTSFLGYAYGAALSWAVEANKTIDMPRSLDLFAFEDAAAVMGRLAYDLGNAYKETGVLVGNSTSLFHLLFAPDASLAGGTLAGLSVDALKRTDVYIERAMARLPEAKMARPDAQLIADEFRNNAAMLRHACRLGIARLEAEGGKIANIPGEKRRALAADLEAIISEYRRLWLARNRPGGLRDSVGRLERLPAMYGSE